MKDDVPVSDERLRELAAGSGEVADLARELLAAREDAAARVEQVRCRTWQPPEVARRLRALLDGGDYEGLRGE